MHNTYTSQNVSHAFIWRLGTAGFVQVIPPTLGTGHQVALTVAVTTHQKWTGHLVHLLEDMRSAGRLFGTIFWRT
jgi:hypothetical protein